MARETSLDKALNVLELIARSGDARLSALAEATGYPPATIHRTLKALVRRGYVRQDPSIKAYKIGLKCLELSSRVRDHLGLVTAARAVMQQLMEQTGETVNLVCFEGAEAVYVEQISNTRSLLRMFTRVGARVPLHSSGVGKAYLATRPLAEARAYFRSARKVRYTGSSLMTEEDFLKDLEQTRRRGYALDREEFEEGVGCIAAVVTLHDAVAAAISISGPSSRLLGKNTARLAAEVVRSAAAVSKRLAEP